MERNALERLVPSFERVIIGWPNEFVLVKVLIGAISCFALSNVVVKSTISGIEGAVIPA